MKTTPCRPTNCQIVNNSSAHEESCSVDVSSDSARMSESKAESDKDNSMSVRDNIFSILSYLQNLHLLKFTEN